MELKVYKEGVVAFSAPILTKGKPGSWWETPVGIYEIQSREENHLSSFSGVYQPWSLAFQGNFFIHGWPYYQDGTPVSSSYSGGCIRLSSEDAKKIYELASIGMPVIVYQTEEKGDSFVYQPKGPVLHSNSSLVVDIKNGTVLAGSNENKKVPIASITKLMTALVAVEYLNLEKQVVTPAAAKVETVIPRLAPGGRESVHDLLILMLTESSNEAAEVLASALGRDYFISLMNDKAKAIGLFETTFADPSGLSKDNISTARDIFLLLQYINQNRHFILDITSGNLERSAYGEVAFGSLNNFNQIIGIKDEFVGGKIGNTDEAKETYAGVYTMNIRGEDREIGVVVLGAEDVQSDVKALLSFIAKLYIDGV
jgi:D-alanyl-D-alanine carboxypeptidase